MPITKKFSIYALFVFVFIIGAALALAVPLFAHNMPQIADTIPLASLYVGNSNTKKVHYTDCPWTRKIPVYYRVYFDSREEALKDGYIPCEVCKP